MANITIASLLEKKEQIKKRSNSTKKLYIESLNGEITIKEPSRELCAESLEMSHNGDSARADAHMTYNCVVEPNLKDAQLQKEFGCAEPSEIVDIIFKAGEVAAISGHCLEMAGFATGVKVLDGEIKKQ
jgi:hypothetical protein